MPRLLVVDDDPLTRDLLLDVLAQEGFEVHQASQPQAALALLRNESFDLIMTDLFGPSYVSLPLEPLRELKQAAGNTPVVVLTARSAATRLTPSELGVADILLKPFEIDGLLARLREILKRRA